MGPSYDEKNVGIVGSHLLKGSAAKSNARIGLSGKCATADKLKLAHSHLKVPVEIGLVQMGTSNARTPRITVKVYTSAHK